MSSDSAIEQGALYLLNRLRDLDATRAGIGAVERRAAPPDALSVVENLQTVVGTLVAAVEDESMCIDYCRRSDVRAVGLVDGT